MAAHRIATVAWTCIESEAIKKMPHDDPITKALVHAASNGIPKIIHQVWRTAEVPQEWADFVKSWRTHHPNWRYRLWTDEESLDFVTAHYPEFWTAFKKFSYDIQRADAIRYLVLHKYGGLYLDLDFECLRPIDDLLSDKAFVICREPQRHAKWLGEKDMIGNCFMASVPGHPFMIKTIEALAKVNPQITSHREVLTTTGPFFLTRVLRDHEYLDVHVLDEHVLFPYPSDSAEMDILRKRDVGHHALRDQCVARGTYAIHYWANSWVKNLAGQLRNPDPFGVPGYKFYPGLDSVGFDISNVGRDIDTLILECNRHKQAVGFNTGGFIKAHIRPKFRWTPIDNPEGNEGLYVKNGWGVAFRSLWNRLEILARNRLPRWAFPAKDGPDRNP